MHAGSTFVATLGLFALSGCGAAPRSASPAPVDCQWLTLPPRFCGSAEDEAIWRDSRPASVQVCNGCLEDGDCDVRPEGACVELPAEGCGYSAFVCVYPGDPCAGDRSGCPGRCASLDGRAVCTAPASTGADGGAR